jgi:hypothetical protein
MDIPTVVVGSLPYNVRLAPFLMTVSILKGRFNKESFMEVLEDYMEHYMIQSFPKYQSVAYGISTYSEVTALPNMAARSPTTSTLESTSVSNITVHIELLNY